MLLLGYSGAGKTCLLMRYAHKAFTETYITTIGIDYRVKYTTLDDKVYRVMWWDTAGQERFRSISASYIKGA
jgi:Ras-related protein Rab-1A